MVQKIDFKKELKELYSPSAKEVTVVDVPEMNFLMIDGKGDPNKGPQFQKAVDALYAVSFTLKFMLKQGEAGRDYVVMPLEGLWWADDLGSFGQGNKGKWQSTLMIMQPQFVTAELVEQAIDEVERKKSPPALSKMRFQSLHEGLSVQIMHIGPYAKEGRTIKKLHSFMRDNGYKFAGKHHEIYLGDPRRTKPERLKTVIRQPIRSRQRQTKVNKDSTDTEG